MVLVPDTRYNIKNSQIWELKYIKEIYWQYIYRKVNRALGDTVDIYSITKVTQTLAETGNPKAFIEYAYDKVMQYISNRDLIKMEEKHIKMIFLSFLSMNEIYIPYSELEMGDFLKDKKVPCSFEETKLHKGMVLQTFRNTFKQTAI